MPAGKHGVAVAALIQQHIAFEQEEADQLFLGTTLQYVLGPWSATANLYAVKNIGGRGARDGASIRDERWDFQYAAQRIALESYKLIDRRHLYCKQAQSLPWPVTG